jgi:hypothetical protein
MPSTPSGPSMFASPDDRSIQSQSISPSVDWSLRRVPLTGCSPHLLVVLTEDTSRRSPLVSRPAGPAGDTLDPQYQSSSMTRTSIIEDVMRVKKNRSAVAHSTPRSVIERLDTRLRHLERISSPGDGNFLVGQANQSFKTIHADGKAPDSILVRSAFIARKRRVAVAGDRDKTPREKPPVGRLVRAQGLALRLELALLFLNQCSGRPGARVPLRIATDDEKDEALGLINLFATGNRQRAGSNYRRSRPAMRARQVENALKILASHSMQLVRLGPAEDGRSPYDTMWLNRETGVSATRDAMSYTKPTSEVVSIPIEFFSHGWIQVLTDSEIWSWLVWRHRAGMNNAGATSARGLKLDAHDRLGLYDLTRDAWDTHQVLDRIGLLTTHAGAITSAATPGGQRFSKEPHEFDIDDGPLAQEAQHAVISAVAALRDSKINP